MWTLDLFEVKLDEWIALEDPRDAVRLETTAWILTRVDDPYDGVHQESGFDNLWYGTVPGTWHGEGNVVICAYWIFERDHVVRCDRFGTLSWPV